MVEFNTEYFDRNIIEDAKQHARDEYPNECCGIVVNNRYYKSINIHPEPKHDFRIDPVDIVFAEEAGKIQAIIHSHNNHAHASAKDMAEQIKSGVPWGIVNIKNGGVLDVFFWGDQLPVAELIGRPFLHGVADCFGLVRDYYRKELDIILKQYPRQFGWWETGEELLRDNILDAGFELVGSDIKDIQHHDGVIAKVKSKVINHCGVYMDTEGGLLLHHLCFNKNRLSNREPLNVYKNYITQIVRYKGL